MCCPTATSCRPGEVAAARADQAARRTRSSAIVKNKATGVAGGPKAASRITLIRDANGDGTPELQVTLLDHLNSPFGVVLVGGDLYVANTDAVVRYPFTPGPDDDHRARAGADAAARRADRPPLDQEPDGQPRRHEAVCDASDRTATSPKTASRPRRTAPRSGRSTARPAPARMFATRPAQPEQPELLPGHQHPVGRRQRARRDRARTWFPII